MRRLVLGALATTLLSGCGAPDNARITSNSLTIYSSLPLRGERATEAKAFLRGEKLALQEAGGRIGDLKVGLSVLDDTNPARGRWAPEVVAANARQAVQNPTTIAYVGDLDSGATAVSLPITNEAGILQVAPLSSATGLTSAAAKGEPEKYYPTARRSFARLVPTDSAEAQALSRWLRAEGRRRVALASDTGVDGIAQAGDVERAVRAAGLELTDVVRVDPRKTDVAPPARDLAEGHPDAVVLTGDWSAAAGSLLRAVRGQSPSVALWATGGAPTTAALAALGPATAALRLSGPAALAGPGGPQARRFAARFRRTFGDPPPPVARYGYEAVRGILAAIRAAGPRGSNRDGVIAAYLGTRRGASVLGPYAIDARGDARGAAVGRFRLAGGGTGLVPASASAG